MDLAQFKSSLHQNSPPEDAVPLLKALWYDAKENWEKAHEIAQDVSDEDGSWVHAYLHRKEGDLSNARYWYARAGRPVPRASLEEEWEDIVGTLLGQ